MSQRSGQLGPGTVLEEVRQLFLEGASGVLEVHTGGGIRRLFFVDGALYLPPTHPLAEPLADFLQKGLAEAGKEAVGGLMQRMATVLSGWDQGTWRFDPGLSAVPPGAVGPLPTAELLVTVIATRDEATLLDGFGGEEIVLRRSDPGGRLRQSVSLGAEDQALLVRLREPCKLSALLAMGEGDRLSTLQGLARLKALTFIVAEQPGEVGEPRVSPELLRSFAERVARDLERRPVELGPDEHRARLAELLGRLGEQNHYDLLGVAHDAPVDRIHAAYEDLARLVHPSHAERLGLTGREGAVTLLFERATEAYLGLSDPQRRSRYNLEMGIRPEARPRTAVVAQEKGDPGERAAGLYEQARGMVEREEYHYAVEILRQAVILAPRAEYWALLAEAQSKNPLWLRQAAESYRQALLLDPENADFRIGLGEVFEAMDQGGRAVSTYRGILVRHPDHAEALAALARLGRRGEEARRPAVSLKPPESGKKPGFFARLFGRR